MIGDYLSVFRNLLLRPRVFFRLLEDRVSFDFSLGFGLISHWVGSFLQFFIYLVFPFLDFSSSFLSSWKILAPEEEFFFKLAWVILDPFLTLFFVLFLGFFVFLGARILIPIASQRDLSYRMILKILFLALGPSLLVWIPGIGIFFAKISSMLVGFFGVREKYHLGTWRTIGVLFFPRFLFLVLASVAVLFLPALLLTFILMQSLR